MEHYSRSNPISNNSCLQEHSGTNPGYYSGMKAAIKALKKSALSKSGSKSIIDFSVAEMR